MEVSAESLYQRYSSMESEELIELHHAGNLTDMALEVLERVLSEKDVSTAERTEVVESLEKESRETVPLASIGDRFVAQIIDAVIAFIVLFIPLITFGGKSDTAAGIGAVAYILYLLFQDALPNGQSIGKRIIKIAVVNKTSGKSCGIGASLVRNIVLVFLGFIDLLFLGSKLRQRLGDMAANTIVINAEEKLVE